MQVNRLFEMLYILLEKENVTAAELAERFEVSTRTVYRDLDLLSGAGIPVYASKGRGGGIRLLPDFTLNKAFFSREERQQLMTSIQSLKAVDIPDAGPALKKLSSIFGDRYESWLEVDFSSWSSTVDRDLFMLLRDAVTGKKRVSFTYYNTKGEKSHREVEPLKILFKANNWYLYGYCLQKEDYRVFRLSRMREARMKEDTVNRSTPKELPWNSKEAQSLEEKAELIQLRLRFHPRLSFYVHDEFLPQQIREDENGFFLVEAERQTGGWLMSYLMSWGYLVEVLEPKELRQEILNAYQEAVKVYSNGDV